MKRQKKAKTTDIVQHVRQAITAWEVTPEVGHFVHCGSAVAYCVLVQLVQARLRQLAERDYVETKVGADHEWHYIP